MGFGNTGFMGGYLNAGQAFAEIEGQQLQNAGNAQLIEQRRRAMEVEARSRAAMMETAARQPSGAPSMGGIPGADFPNAGAEMGGVPSGQTMAGGTGTPAMASGKPKLSDVLMGEYQRATAQARGQEKAGAIDKALAFTKDADAALAKATQARNEERKEEHEMWGSLRNLASAPYDQQSLDIAAATAKAQFGPAFDKFMSESGVDRDPSGKWLWNDRTKNAVKAIGELATTKEQRIGNELKQMEAERRAESAAEQKRHNLEQEQTTREIVQLRRDGQEVAKDIREKREAEKKEKGAVEATLKVQRRLDGDPIYKNWSKYEVVGDQAKNIVTTLNKTNGYQLVQPSDLNALSIGFRNMEEGFRGRAGGKFELLDQNSFNSALGKLDKYVESLGRGTMKWNETTTRDVVNTVTEIRDIANKAAVTVSLEGMEQAAKLGGKADAITMKGDIRRLKEIGQFSQVVENGKTYLVVGKPGGNQRRFEVVPDKE